MPVNKVTADQFVSRLQTSILSRNEAHDVEIGPIADIVTQPSGQVLETVNDRIRNVSQLILLDQSAVFTDSDVDAFVKNEELYRNLGGKSSGTVIFSRSTIPTVDITVQRGFPIATQPSESSGETVVFVTTEIKTMVAANAAAYYNITTNRYELEVAIQCTVSGKIGEIGPNRIVRPLRALTGFDKVYNRNRTSTVVDREVNSQLIERYKLAIMGTQLGTRTGIRLFIISNFQDAGDVLVITSGSSLITRSGINGNAVDVFITGSQLITRQDVKTFIGVGQLIELDSQPVDSISGIPGYVLGTDFEFVKDVSGVSNSIRSKDSIRFLSTATTLPIVGSSITIDYNQNVLIDNIQNAISNDADNETGGQDILIRLSNKVLIVINGTLTVLNGFSFTTIKNAVISVIYNYINNLKQNDDVEASDLQAQIRSISGVDNFVFTILDRLGGTGNSDVIINQNEYARIETTNITII